MMPAMSITTPITMMTVPRMATGFVKPLLPMPDEPNGEEMTFPALSYQIVPLPAKSEKPPYPPKGSMPVLPKNERSMLRLTPRATAPITMKPSPASAVYTP